MLSLSKVIYLTLTSAFSVATVIFYFMYLMEKRFTNILWLVVPTTIGLLVPTYCFLRFNNSNLNFIISIVVIIFILLFFKPIKQGLYYAGYLEVINLLADGLVACVMSILSIDRDSPLAQIILYIVTAILVFIFAKNLKFFQDIDLPKAYSLAFMAIPVFSIGILYVVFSNYDNKLISTLHTILVVLFVCGLNSVSIFMYRKIVEYFLLKVQSKALACQIEAFVDRQNLYTDAFKALYTLQHNMKNQLIPISILLESGKIDSARSKLTEALGNYDVMQYSTYTGIALIDDMINYKKFSSDSQSITFLVSSNIVRQLNINYIDLSVMLGIALDNAIEANAECIDKYVKIELYTKENAFIVSVSNCLTHAIKRDKSGKIQSTKIDNAPHGIGLLSIITLLNENGGEHRISTDNGVFKITLVLFDN